MTMTTLAATVGTKVLAVEVSARFELEVPQGVTQMQARDVVIDRIQGVAPAGVTVEVVALTIRRRPRPGEIVEAGRNDHREYAVVVTAADGTLMVEFADGLRLPVPQVAV